MEGADLDTLTEWNTLLTAAEANTMPTFPAPTLVVVPVECFYLIGTGTFGLQFGYSYSPSGAPEQEFRGRKYRVVTISKAVSFSEDDGPSGSGTYSRTYTKSLVDEVCNLEIVGTASWSTSWTLSYPDGPPGGDYTISVSSSGSCVNDVCSGTQTVVLAISGSDTNPTGGLDIAMFGDETVTWTGTSWVGTRDNGSVTIAYSEEVGDSFYWVVPDTWEGDAFKVTWNVIEEPEGWDDEEPTVLRTWALEDQEWTWTGPGDPEDPESWKSTIFELGRATRRVVNVRFEAYPDSPYGSRPLLMGEQITLPDPVPEP